MLRSYFSYAVIDSFWWRLDARFLSGLLFVSVSPVPCISTQIHVFIYFRVLLFFFFLFSWDMQAVSLLSKSDCYMISFQLCLHNTHGFSSHSYGAVMETCSTLFPYCIFSTAYFSDHSVWVLWYVFFFCCSVCIWGMWWRATWFF